MNKKTHVYNPVDVVVMVGGVYLTGFAEDSMIELEQRENDIIDTPDVYGNYHYSINHDKGTIMKVVMMSTSPHLPFLMNLARGEKPFPVAVTDMNDHGMSFANDECIILKTPNYIRNKEAEDVEIEVFIPYWEW